MDYEKYKRFHQKHPNQEEPRQSKTEIVLAFILLSIVLGSLSFMGLLYGPGY